MRIVPPINLNYDFGEYKHYNLKCKNIGEFSEGLVKVLIDNKWGYANNQGEIVIPCQYDNAGDFHENRAHVEIDHKSGYINMLGEVVIPLEYKMARIYENTTTYVVYTNFKNGVASVSKDGTLIYIDKYGHVIENITIWNNFLSIG